jgi:hypothetical protein
VSARLLDNPDIIYIFTLVMFAATSAWLVTDSVKEEDVVSAWVWTVIFLFSSLLAVFTFWIDFGTTV